MDYLYMVAYVSCISPANVLVAECLAGQSAFWGLIRIVQAWAQLGAALLDAVENVGPDPALVGLQAGTLALVRHPEIRDRLQ